MFPLIRFDSPETGDSSLLETEKSLKEPHIHIVIKRKKDPSIFCSDNKKSMKLGWLLPEHTGKKERSDMQGYHHNDTKIKSRLSQSK